MPCQPSNCTWRVNIPCFNTMQDIDAGFTKVLDKISAVDQDPMINKDNFQEFFPYNFTTLGSDGKEVELRAGGADIAVTCVQTC